MTFSRTSFRFLPESPTILADIFVLFSDLAIPIIIVPWVYFGEEDSIEQIVPIIVSGILFPAWRIRKFFPEIFSIFSATFSPDTNSVLYFV